MSSHKSQSSDDEQQKFQSVRGMHDLLPDDHNHFTVLKKAIRHRCRQAGFRRISTPALEDVGVFERTLGTNTDVIEKEMYKIEIGDHQYALKPESTASICRSYIQNGMSGWRHPVQLYYIEPHYRHDRPQKGRFREFRQFGVEVLGGRDASLDAQVILLAYKVFEDLEIENRFTLQVNTIGTAKVRKKYEDVLRDYFLPKMRNLSPDSQKRVETNPLRIFDSKDEDDQILCELAPKFQDYLDDASKEYFQEVCSYLDAVNIPYIINQKLVRGLDYYCDTVFEFVDDDGLSVCAGGRYDGLVKMLGGPDTPGFGFAAGIERLISHLQDAGITPPEKDHVDVYVACLGSQAKAKAMNILSDLHDIGVHAIGAIGKNSMRNQLQIADKLEASWTLILGDVEVRERTIILRDMKNGSQERIQLDTVIERLKNTIPHEQRDVWKLGE